MRRCIDWIAIALLPFAVACAFPRFHADPGVSRLHAVLLRSRDGSWSVVDPGSANGTEVNGSEIPQGQPVPLRDGDRIHLGAWTELRVVCGS